MYRSRYVIPVLLNSMELTYHISKLSRSLLFIGKKSVAGSAKSRKIRSLMIGNIVEIIVKILYR